MRDVFEQIGYEIMVPAFMALVGFIVGIMRVYGMEAATKYLNAAAPFIVDAINRAKADGQITGPEAKAEALRAAREIMPVWVKMFAGIGLASKAGPIIERAHLLDKKYMSDGSKKHIQSLGLSATTNGKALGAEIKANFKRGNLSLLGEVSKTPRVTLGGTFKF